LGRMRPKLKIAHHCRPRPRRHGAQFPQGVYRVKP
jgi:hypothetical protein